MYIILVQPKNPGNIGSIARAMKNFNLKDLVLIKPICDHLSKEALDRATHAKGILKKAVVADFGFLDTLDYAIGTTSVLGTDYNISRSPITPEQLAEKLKGIKKSNIGILIGREDHGLTNKEIEKCDFLVTIPASKKYPTMNMSHAVAVILYELFKKSKDVKVADHIRPAGKKEKEIMLKKINSILDKMDFSTKAKKETQKLIWKRILGKSFLTQREISALFGFFRKLEKKYTHSHNLLSK